MPRVYTSANDPLDFCRRCFPTEEAANDRWGAVGVGPDGRENCFSWDAEHPYYGGCKYQCETCGVRLYDRDNHA